MTAPSSKILFAPLLAFALGHCGDSAIIDRGGRDVVSDQTAMMSDGSNQDAPDVATVDVQAVDVPDFDVPTDGGMDATVADTGVIIEAGPDVVCPPMNIGCNGVCVDPQVDMNHCGMCGRVCPMGQRCNLGVCSANCGVEGLVCCPDNMCNAGFDCVMGMCRMRPMPVPVRSGADLVSAGARLSSMNFQMQSTLGQSSQHQRRMLSTNFVLTGGLVGVIGGP